MLKYPHEREVEIDRFRTEYEILNILGQNPCIIGLKGYMDDGLYLERSVNGDVRGFLTANPTISFRKQLTWCRQATEAVAYTHSKRVLHHDIRPLNLLLDKNRDLKLANFQGRHLSMDREILLNGFSGKLSKFPSPRDPPDYADIKTDVFALSSTIYSIVTGHDVFSDIHVKDDGSDTHACSAVTARCWEQTYSTAIGVARKYILACKLY